MQYQEHELIEFKNNIDIVSTIQSYIDIQQKGSNYIGSCPFHQEKTASFIVSPTKQRFKCFGCHESGDVIDFVVKYNNVSFQEALKSLGFKSSSKNHSRAVFQKAVKPPVKIIASSKNLNVLLEKIRYKLLKTLNIYYNKEKNIKNLDDLEKDGYIFQRMAEYEYYLDIIEKGSYGQKVELIQNYNKTGLGLN